MTFSLCFVCDKDQLYQNEVMLAESVFLSMKARHSIIDVKDVGEIEKRLAGNFNIILFDADNSIITADEFVNIAMVMQYKAVVIFICSQLNQKYRLLPARPFGFVDKRHIDTDLVNVLNLAVNNLKAMNEKPLIFNLTNGLIRVFPGELLYIENNQIYLSTGEKYTVVTKKEQLKAQLSDCKYLWLKHNCVLNISNIESFDKRHITMRNGRIFDRNNKINAQVEKQIKAAIY